MTAGGWFRILHRTMHRPLRILFRRVLAPTAPVVLVVTVLFSSCDFNSRTPDPAMDAFDRAVELYQRNDYPSARTLFTQAIDGFEKAGNQDKATIARTYLAQILLETYQLRAALDNLGQASAQVTKAGDALGNLRLTILEGDVYFAAGDLATAYERYRAASSVADAFADRTSAAQAHLKIGRCLLFAGEPAQALNELQTALNLSNTGNDPTAIAAARLSLGQTLRRLRRLPEAQDMLTKGMDALSRPEDAELRTRLQLERGRVLVDQGNANGALQDMREAVNDLRRQHAGSQAEPLYLYFIARLYEQNGRWDEARTFYGDAITVAHAVGDRFAAYALQTLLERMSYRALPPAEQTRRGGEWIRRLRSVAEQFHLCAHAIGEATVDALIADIARRSGDLSTEQDFLTKAVVLEQSDLAEYADPELHRPYLDDLGNAPDHHDWYLRLADVFVRQQRPAEALKMVDLARRKELARGFTGEGISLRSDNGRPLAEEVRSLNARGALTERELTAQLCRTRIDPASGEARTLKARLDALKHEVQTKSAAVMAQWPNDALTLPVQPVDPATVQRLLPEGSVAVEFLPGRDRLTIFSLTHSRLAMRSVRIGRDSLQALVLQYDDLLQDPRVYSGDPSAASVTELTVFSALSTRLYDLLIRPVEDVIDRGVIVIPGGFLDGFPFHTIERQDRRGDVKYLVELTNVDYLPSLAALRYRVTTTPRVHMVTAFGNPTGKNWAVDYELRDLRSFFRNARVLVGLETSWDNLKSVSGDVLQLATEFSGQDVMMPLGELALSDGLTTEQSTAVRFEMLSELPAVPVILLSNQGGGTTRLGAMHAALLRANGTADVFLNSWMADRKAAKFFSEHFFTYLAQGLAPGDAYRQALLNLIRIREVSHPRSWGQFFHFGIG